jgi:putative ABC transport system permease protein
MLQSYFKVAWRNLKKSRAYTIINIIGLGLAIAATLFIFNYVSYERSYDQFHSNKKNIYRVSSHFNKGKVNERHQALTIAWTGPGAQLLIPEIADFTRLAPANKFIGKKVIRYNDTKISESRVLLADSSFLKMFSFPLVRGSAATALTEPFSMILTESIAKKYFGSPDLIMNKVVELKSKGHFAQETFKVTGIIKDPPPNSHIQFDVLLSFNTLYDYIYTGGFSFDWAYTYNYIQLNDDADPIAVGKKMTALRDSLYQNEIYKEPIEFVLQPLTGIHLDSHLKDEFQRNNDRSLINLLLFIGVFILILGYINYINIAVAKSFDRAREIGVRKTFGAERIQLIKQFLAEAFIVNVISVTIAVLFSLTLTPFINRLLGIDHLFTLSQLFGIVALIVILILAGTLMSGLYPAFILSSFKPVDVLKEKFGKAKGLIVRKFFVVGQFMIGILLLSGAIAVFKQLKYMKEYDVGADLGQTLVVEGLGSYEFSEFEYFRTELLKYPAVQSVSASSLIPGDELGLQTTQLIDKNGNKTAWMNIQLVDKDFFDLMKVKLAGGRSFDFSSEIDKKSILLNEAAAKAIGYDDPSKATNQHALWAEGMYEHGGQQTRIVGIVENYYQQSLKEKPQPIIYMPKKFYNPVWTPQYYIVRFKPGEERQTLGIVEAQWRKLFKGDPFNYFFLEDHFNLQYEQEQKFAYTFTVFTILAIIIAAMGLYGLSSFTILKRTKEVAIRKVLAASNTNIFTLLAADYFELILIAYLVSMPVGYYAIKSWLDNYSHRVQIGLWYFVLPVLIVLTIGMLSITYNILKASRKSPVNALKNS